MRSVFLSRIITGDDGTLGLLTAGDRTFWTMELPWRDNQRAMSCIPEGEYECHIRKSRKYGWVYHIRSVPDRSDILLHNGNVAGGKGYVTHSKGCILLGTKFGRLKTPSGVQRAVLLSKKATRQFRKHMGHQPFMLIVGGMSCLTRFSLAA